VSGLIGVINYGMGNIKSVCNAFEHFGEEVRTFETIDGIEACSHLILPGVGAFPKAMANLRERGFVAAIRAHVAAARPFLGICLGMQVLADEGEEIAPTKGIGLIPGRVRRLDVPLHIPHVGWNNVERRREHPIFNDVPCNVDFYFVHSYFVEQSNPAHLLAVTDYGRDIPCAVTDGGCVVAVQFHPEKSQENGLRILENFALWDGRLDC
jgi:glutamine amidotransferase